MTSQNRDCKMNTLILVDIFDKEIGYAEKAEIHKAGILHRAFSIFIHHHGKMLLQQRAYEKYHSGGLWTNACCSHPRKGETILVAAHRQLQHELNIPQYSCILKEIFNFVYFQKYSDHLFEYEYDYVLLADYGGAFAANPAEIVETNWIPFPELQKDLLKNPEIYSAWFLIAAPKVLRYLSGIPL
jgi:isopentenyl-diphosphate Delta-isomerase